jgi:hypothetical protein
MHGNRPVVVGQYRVSESDEGDMIVVRYGGGVAVFDNGFE